MILAEMTPPPSFNGTEESIMYFRHFMMVTAALVLPVVMSARTNAEPPALSFQEVSDHRPEPSPLVARVHTIAELIPPSEAKPEHPDTTNQDHNKKNPDAGTHSAQDKSAADDLMALISETIEPASWAKRGGQGTMAYHALGMALVIQQTPEVHQKIAEVLATLRRLQDVNVGIEIRLLTMSEETYERVVKALEIETEPSTPSTEEESNHLRPVQTTTLDDAKTTRLLEILSGDRKSKILLTPKMSVLNGRTATLHLGDVQYFVTDIDVVSKGDQVSSTPRNQPFSTGLDLSARPVVAADRESVQIDLKASMTSLDSVVPLFPFTTCVTTETKDGMQDVTQFVQQPKFAKTAVDRSVKVANGATALLYGWSKLLEAHSEFATPLLGKIPYIKRWFMTVGYGRDNEITLLLVTPRFTEQQATLRTVAAQDEAESDHLEKQRKLAELKALYREACSSGKMIEAKRLAGAALALDPGCFENSAQKQPQSSDNDLVR